LDNKTKIPFIFFILIYFQQGFVSLPDQALYYLTREVWLLTAGTIGLISFITGLAWYCKPVFGFLMDNFKLGKQSSRNYLLINAVGLITMFSYIIIFGLNSIASIITTGILINIFIGCSDVANDSQMVIYEQKYNLKGKLQAIQWTALGVAGLIVAVLGAKIPSMFPALVAYKYAYGIALIVPFVIIGYLLTGYKEEATVKKDKIDWKEIWKELKNKQLIIALLFIAFLQLCPSFGTALMIKAREQLMVGKMFLGYLGATGTVLGITGYMLYYWKFNTFPLKKLLYFMIIFSAVTNLFYLYIPNKWFLVGYNLAFGAFGGIAFLTLLAFFAQIVPKGNEGTFYALVTSLSNLCGRGGNWIGGMIYDAYGYNATVIISTLFTLACLFFIPKLRIKEKS